MKLHSIFILGLIVLLSSCVIRVRSTVDEFKVSADKFSFVQTYEAKPGLKLVVSTPGGNIIVRRGENNAVKVSVVVTNRIGQVVVMSLDELKKYARFRFEMNNNELNLIVEDIFHDNMSIGFQIESPAESRSRLETAGGNLIVEGLIGNQDLSTSGGNIVCKNVEGTLAAETSGGNIAVTNLKGSSKVETSGGNILASDLQGELDAQTSGGNIAVNRISGALRVETSGGNISLSEAASSVYASTSGGQVSAAFSVLEAPVTLYTSGGVVSCKVPESAAFDVQLSGDPISADLKSFQGNKQENYIQGKINGGGPLLKMKSEGGAVRLSN